MNARRIQILVGLATLTIGLAIASGFLYQYENRQNQKRSIKTSLQTQDMKTVRAIKEIVTSFAEHNGFTDFRNGIDPEYRASFDERGAFSLDFYSTDEAFLNVENIDHEECVVVWIYAKKRNIDKFGPLLDKLNKEMQTQLPIGAIVYPGTICGAAGEFHG